MRIDGAVCRAKFDQEVQRLESQRETLAGWGCWVARVAFPVIDVVFVPRAPLVVTEPMRASSIIVVQRPPLVDRKVGFLAARAFGARISLDDYDQRAPSVVFRDPWTWEVLGPEALPAATFLDEGGGAMPIMQGGHPATGLPFLCARGIREYHDHPQHGGDDWMLYRGSMGAFHAISVVWRTCIMAIRPRIASASSFNIGWEPVREEAL